MSSNHIFGVSPASDMSSNHISDSFPAGLSMVISTGSTKQKESCVDNPDETALPGPLLCFLTIAIDGPTWSQSSSRMGNGNSSSPTEKDEVACHHH